MQKQPLAKDEPVVTGTDPVQGPFTVEPNRAMYRARIFGKRKVQKATTFNRQNGRTPAQYKAARFEGYFNDIMNKETEAK
jgi:hypothetical protein